MTRPTTPPAAFVAGRIVVASVSGGKDSAALSLWLTENGIEHRRVFADTGWEHPATYEYLRGPLTAALGHIDEVRGPDGGMVALIRRKGMFPSRLRRFCTEDLKVRPLVAYVAAIQESEGETINAVGIRAAESRARSKLTEAEWSDAFDCEVWRPLLHWSEQDVIDIHKRHGLMPNPLYLRGASRVGCWPCINARKEEVRLVADLTPERIDEIRALESELSESTAMTFFHGRGSADDKTGIDSVAAWSQTDRGGKQLPLLRDEPDGCVRWGVCE